MVHAKGADKRELVGLMIRTLEHGCFAEEDIGFYRSDQARGQLGLEVDL